jgi:hypothetical protein
MIECQRILLLFPIESEEINVVAKKNQENMPRIATENMIHVSLYKCIRSDATTMTR